MKYRIIKWGGIAVPEAFGIQCQNTKGTRDKHLCATIKGIRRALIYTTRERALEVIESIKLESSPDLETGLVPLQSDTES